MTCFTKEVLGRTCSMKGMRFLKKKKSVLKTIAHDPDGASLSPPVVFLLVLLLLLLPLPFALSLFRASESTLGPLRNPIFFFWFCPHYSSYYYSYYSSYRYSHYYSYYCSDPRKMQTTGGTAKNHSFFLLFPA